MREDIWEETWKACHGVETDTLEEPFRSEGGEGLLEGDAGLRSLAKSPQLVWCGALKLREGSWAFVPQLPATEDDWIDQWPREDPEAQCILHAGVGTGLCSTEEGSGSFSVWSALGRPHWGRKGGEDPRLSFLFFSCIHSFFLFVCLFLRQILLNHLGWSWTPMHRWSSAHSLLNMTATSSTTKPSW